MTNNSNDDAETYSNSTWHRNEDDQDCSGSSNDNQGQTDSNEIEAVISKRTSKAIWLVRLTVLLVLIVSAITVSFMVYKYMSEAEQEEFDKQFESDANKLIDAIGSTIDSTISANNALITKIVAFARYSNSTWPFVTMPGFSIQAIKTLKVSKAFSIQVSPRVLPEQVEQWNNYSQQHNGWVRECLDVLASEEDWMIPIDYSIVGKQAAKVVQSKKLVPSGLPDWDNTSETTPMPDGDGTYLPLWQQAPFSQYNLDSWSQWANSRSIKASFDTQQVTIGYGFQGVLFDRSNREKAKAVSQAQAWALAMLGKSMSGDNEQVQEPFITMNFPISDTFGSVRMDRTKKLPIVGNMASSVYVREFLKNLLPEKSKGIMLVIANPCVMEEVFTYRVDGSVATFLGIGDQHSSQYDAYAQGTSFGLLDEDQAKKSPRTGLPLAKDFCDKTITIYPSENMENEYKSNKPLIFMLVAASIFVFTSLVFILYDLLVAHRQRIVMNRAMASGAIVNSLFPKSIRDQMYQENEDIKKQQVDKKKNVLSAIKATSGAVEPIKGRPMADLFINSTIIFMDIVGFTKWSAKRTPVAVFELLETIYGAFDQIATRRGVFKVETVGDCYVAATGIPEPQSNHAVIMMRFARECLVQMHKVVVQLSATMGQDTRDLMVRVGVHSGNCTAGVLRGEKGRFQLFGDTVNIASRMESTGVPGRIHVSQAFADALAAKGKGYELVEREDLVDIKGKGATKTFFVKNEMIRGSESTSSGGLQSSHSCSSGDLECLDEAEDLENRLSRRLAGGSFSRGI